MIEGFLGVIRNVGIFIVCAQAIIHFRPKASYEKYLKVLVSIIVLVMLMVPCFQMLGNVEELLYSMHQYENYLSGNGQTVWGEYKPEVNSELNNPIETIVIEPVEVIE